MARLQKFITWYNEKLKKMPLIVLITTIVAVVAGLNTVYDGLQVVKKVSINVHSFFNKYDKEYDQLKQVNTGINADYLASIYGVPNISRTFSLETSTYKEMFWAENRYLLYIIADPNNIVSSYSVTILDLSFNPEIPLKIDDDKKDKGIRGLKLGEMRLKDLLDYNPIWVSADASSKFVSCSVTYYFGNPGFYKSYIFGYTPAGVYTLNDNISKIISNCAGKTISEIDDSSIEYIRQNLRPNSFAVIDEEVDEALKHYLMEGMIGIDYFDAREFMEH